MAYPINELTSESLRSIQRMADRLQWDPIDKIDKLETMSILINLCIGNERANDRTNDELRMSGPSMQHD